MILHEPILVKRREIRSTRLFLMSLLISILFLATYTFSILRIKSETVEQPALRQYDQLEKLYSNTLSCRCAKVSISYDEFITITPSYHQVCSSDFISQSWIDFPFGNNRTSLWPMDLRTSLSFMWQLMAAMCQHSQITFDMSVEDFQLSSFISSKLFSRQLLESKMQAAIDSFRQSASNRLVQSLKTIHQMSLMNDFLTGTSTNHVVCAARPNVSDPFYVLSIMSTGYLRSGDEKNMLLSKRGFVSNCWRPVST